MCSFSPHSLFWFDNSQLNSHILELVAYDRDFNEIKSYKSPLRIEMPRTRENENKNYITCEETVPFNTSEWKNDILNSKICILMFKVYMGQGVIMHFKNVNENVTIDVVNKYGEKPIYDDFKNATVITMRHDYYSLELKRIPDDPIMVYVGVLPNKSMVIPKERASADEYEFKYSFDIVYEFPTCISYNYRKESWRDTHCVVIIRNNFRFY